MESVVFTNKAECRDCYRCLRSCPVKAISMNQGQAQVVAELCIACGTCIRECPQGAKSYRKDLSPVRALLAAGERVAVSLAPSFAAAFEPWERRRLASALRKLGAVYVAETAIGAYQVARRTAEIIERAPDRPHIASACPAVVSYIEKYAPDLLDCLVPVVSPMIAHAQHIREKLGAGTRVIFVGPCTAKKAEADREALAGMVDAVLTFAELSHWFEAEGIDLAALEESDFDEYPPGDARLFPLVGGANRTASLTTDVLDRTVVAVHGVQALREVVESLRKNAQSIVVEALFCAEGCINGPAMPADGNLFDRRRQVLDHAQQSMSAERKGSSGSALSEKGAALIGKACAAARFAAEPAAPAEDECEAEIRRVLALTGKVAEADELNCGACGYESCRQKARAVLRGLAEPEMCIPYMRRLAERRTDRILETSPNGIVILDDQLRILSMNPAFCRYFMCSEAVLGKPISYLMDPHHFERVAGGEENLVETTVVHERYNVVCHEILYALRDDRQYVGIFVNITRSKADRERLDQVRAETMLKARQLQEHQVAMAQKIAQYLGESMACGEELLEKLMVVVDDNASGGGKAGGAGEGGGEGGGPGKWPMRISK